MRYKELLRQYKYEIALIIGVIILSCFIILVTKNMNENLNLNNYFWLPSAIMQSIAAIYALFIAVLVLSIQSNQKTISLMGDMLKPPFKVVSTAVAVTIYFNGFVLLIFSNFKPVHLEVNILYYGSLLSLLVSLISIIYFSFWMITNVTGLKTHEEMLCTLTQGEDIETCYSALDIEGDLATYRGMPDTIINKWSIKSPVQQHKEIEYIIKLLKNGTPEMRINLTRFLSIIGDERASEQLIENLNDDNHRVVEYSISALGGLKIERAFDKISEKLYHPDPEVRERSATVLSTIDSKKAVFPLIERLDKLEYYGFVTRTIVNVLGNIGDKNAVEAIIKKLDDPEKTIRWAAAEALGKIGGKRAEEELTNRLNSDEEALRNEARKALENIRKRKEK